MVLVFDVKSDLALFRKPYTTTSMISYPFPPPTAVAGLLGAVVGIDHGAADDGKQANYWRELKGVQVAVSIRRPVSWYTTAVNLMKYKNTNANMGEHIQVKHQMLKNPCFRVYVKGGNNYTKLKEYLERQEFIYTPCLGPAFTIADINYIGEYSEIENSAPGDVHTVIPHGEGMILDVLKSGGVFKETVPFRMDSNRRSQESVTVYYGQKPLQGETVKLVLKNSGGIELSQVGEERVAWFDAW
ncbi:MAG: type I-B CRISPR-associated protein Cas5b [Syntrophomonas sp.]